MVYFAGLDASMEETHMRFGSRRRFDPGRKDGHVPKGNRRFSRRWAGVQSCCIRDWQDGPDALPRALSPAFKDAAIAAIDGDIKKMTRRSKVCQRLMTVPGVGPITALAFAAAIDDPHRFKTSRDVGAYLGLVPQRHQSDEIDDTGSISKRGDVNVRTLPYEAANVMRARYAAPRKLKSWALAIAGRSTMRKARVALARRLAIILHAIMRDQTNFKAA